MEASGAITTRDRVSVGPAGAGAGAGAPAGDSAAAAAGDSAGGGAGAGAGASAGAAPWYEDASFLLGSFELRNANLHFTFRQQTAEFQQVIFVLSPRDLSDRTELKTHYKPDGAVTGDPEVVFNIRSKMGYVWKLHVKLLDS